jgi:hypothetical protein
MSPPEIRIRPVCISIGRRSMPTHLSSHEGEGPEWCLPGVKEVGWVYPFGLGNFCPTKRNASILFCGNVDPYESRFHVIYFSSSLALPLSLSLSSHVIFISLSLSCSLSLLPSPLLFHCFSQSPFTLAISSSSHLSVVSAAKESLSRNSLRPTSRGAESSFSGSK